MCGVIISRKEETRDISWRIKMFRHRERNQQAPVAGADCRCCCHLRVAVAGGGCRLLGARQLPVAGCRLPVPVAGCRCRLPVAGCRLPVAGCRCRLPVAGCRLPAAGCRLPVAGCRLSVPVAGCQLPAARCRLPVPVAGCRCRLPVDKKCILCSIHVQSHDINISSRQKTCNP